MVYFLSLEQASMAACKLVRQTYASCIQFAQYTNSNSCVVIVTGRLIQQDVVVYYYSIVYQYVMMPGLELLPDPFHINWSTLQLSGLCAHVHL